MITVDDRAGSQTSGSFNFVHHLKRFGAPVRVHRLHFADFAFTGKGPHGLVRVGIERKTVDELLGAWADDRFVGTQLPGLLNSYDVPVLVVEGKSWMDPRSGVVMLGKWDAGRGRSRHLWTNYIKFQLSLLFKGRIVIWPTRSKMETVAFLHSVHDWYQKRWTDHKAVYRIDDGESADPAMLDERTLRRRVAAQLPGVGWVRSKKVEQAFPSVISMMTATETDWKDALGIRDGRKIARGIVSAILREPVESQLTRSLKVQGVKPAPLRATRVLPFQR
jgi:ERCC4-type nuclease